MKQLKTKWADTITPDNVLPEYPRPTLVRKSYLNLNGTWQYAITKTEDVPEAFEGTILVPFSPETELSGVSKRLMPNEYLWYGRVFTIVRPQSGKRLLLHFGAVDYTCEVYINGIHVGGHSGGYLPFSFDITDVVGSGENHLLVKVQDPTDTSYHSRGKQTLKPGGMYYSPQSGIWQTVWAEIVPENYIENIYFVPDYDTQTIYMRIQTAKNAPVSCTISGEGLEPFLVQAESNVETAVKLPIMYSWTPENPYLYQVSLSCGLDQVSSYFAMRKCDIQSDHQGIRRIFLNNEPYLQAGVLNQGYWPESLYTPPCDEALEADIIRMKELGFNMLRVHAKVESPRFYYHCDKHGMLVWQDIVNGGSSYKSWFVTYLATLMNCSDMTCLDGPEQRKLLSRQDEAGIQEYYEEALGTVQTLFNHPSIVVWVPFNEGWGQFDANKVTEYIRQFDKDRLIDQASGWFDQGGGDFKSKHFYFFSLNYEREEKRALALTEYGGYSLRDPDHSACSKVYGYKKFKTKEALMAGYEKLYNETLLPAVKDGFSALVLTQLSDIEEETNGIYTYDREVLKFDADKMREWNQLLKEHVGY